ncbi:hypothetical protein [Sphingomonas soli]|uniref:hypothetical protein n=1 Tax=Sphingomonas soli TaxID=266127 RepID=UPI0012EDC626|nr:hypothetical protein [Sphingomonas soli]
MSARFGGPYHAGKLIWQGEAVYDDGGSIIDPGTPVEFECMVQIDSVTEAMRAEAGYTDKDVRLIILAPGLGKVVDTDAALEVLAGPHTGSYTIAGQSLDTLGFAFDGRGRGRLAG